jgi:ABC-type glycerol-3-phosphate transport system permease component
MGFEKKRQGLLTRRQFIVRISRHLLISIGIVLISLGIGVLGYWYFERMSFLDALLNASMILGGMGPVTQLATPGGKIFASFYALFSAFAFLSVAGVMFTPLIHRLLHRFHLDEED